MTCGRILVLLALAGIPLSAFGQAVAQTDLGKLDPRFRSVVAEEIPALGLKADGSRPDQLEVEKRVGKTEAPLYGAAIYTDNVDELRAAGIEVNSQLEGFVTARVTAQDLLLLAGLPGVTFVDAGETLYPDNDVAVAVTGAHLLQAGKVNSTVYDGTGVITCIIDTGIDWDHADFTDDGSPSTSRILYIWDQTLTKTGSEDTPADAHVSTDYDGYSYGVEYTQAHINEDLDGAADGLTVRESDTDGHGTHVAGTAAGDGTAVSGAQYKGMAPDADLVVIKAGNGSFSFTNVINGMNYCGAIASDAGKPVVVNMSLGTSSGPHDGSRSQDTAIDSFIGAGKVVVVSAGNSGNDDMHKTATIADAATGSTTLVVPSFTATSGTNNDDLSIDIWFIDQTGTVTVVVTSPNALDATQAAGSSTTATDDGDIYIFNGLDGTSGDRHVQIEIDDGTDASKTPAVGSWTIAITNTSGGSLTYHAWLYDALVGSSTVTMTGGDNNYVVGSPGTATGAITVGAFASRAKWCSATVCGISSSATLSDDLASFSSFGPRTDSGAPQKPDIVGPGHVVASSWSTDMTDPEASRQVLGLKHRLTQGTSMSSPAVAGGIALLLDETSTLTATQIRTLIRDSADQDGFTGTVPNDSWGYGKFNVHQAMVRHLSGTPGAHEISNYDTWATSSGIGLTGGSHKVGVRFTPTVSGTVSGLFFHTAASSPSVTSLNAEVWSNSSNLPSAKQGSSVAVATSTLAGNTWNYVDMTGAGVSVVAGTDYHAVLDYVSGTTLSMDSDTGSIDSRSSLSTSGTWAAYGSGDWRLRPVVTNNSAVTILGTAATGNDAGWRMLAPPSTGMTRTSIAGITFSSSDSGNDLVRRFDESAGSGDAQWINTGSGVSLPQGQGFIAYLFDDGTDPVNPNLTVSWAGAVETTADFTTASLDTNEEFHLLGNPFYSTFDLSHLNLTAQDFQSTVQVWNPSTSSYTSVAQSGGSTDLIAMGQGFFAQRSTTSVGNTTVSYDADGRTKAGTLLGKRSEIAEAEIGLWLSVTDQAGKLVAFDESAGIVFRPEATDGWDVFEASKLTPLVPAFATVSLLGERDAQPELLSQASYPLVLSKTVEVPLEVDAVGISGHATLSWPRMEGIPDDWDIELVDGETGYSIDVRRSSGYSFAIVGSGAKSDNKKDVLAAPLKMASSGVQRFVIRLSPSFTTGLEGPELPKAYSLEQNYPNPFNPATTIRFALPQAGDVRLSVFDVLGRQIEVVLDGRLEAGWHDVTFNASGLASGLYLYRLTTADGQLVRPMQLLR
jgi:subtilisin family serine protease